MLFYAYGDMERKDMNAMLDATEKHGSTATSPEYDGLVSKVSGDRDALFKDQQAATRAQLKS